MMERPYYIDFGTFRLVIHKLVTSKYFDLGISAVIGLNVITMAMEFYMMPDVSHVKFPRIVFRPIKQLSFITLILHFLQELEKALKMFNFFFTAAFCLEAALKVAALGLERYFSEKYDFRHMTA